MKQNDLSKFSKGLSKEHSGEIISKSVNRFSRSRLKVFLFIALAAILFRAILVEIYQRNIPVKLFNNKSNGLAEKLFKAVFYL